MLGQTNRFSLVTKLDLSVKLQKSDVEVQLTISFVHNHSVEAKDLIVAGSFTFSITDVLLFIKQHTKIFISFIL